jgi:hypothetical protein
MTTEDFHADIQAIADISDTVNEYISGEYYMEGHDDTMLKPRDILLECYSTLMDELSELGISFHDPTDMVSNFFTARTMYYIRKFLSGEELFAWFKNDDDNLPDLQDMLHTDSDFCSDFLNQLIERGLVDPVYENELKDKSIIDAQILGMHIEGVASRLLQVGMFEMENPQWVIDYIQHLEEVRAGYKHTATQLFENLSEKSLLMGHDKVLHQLIENYDIEKFTSDDINLYARKHALADSDLSNAFIIFFNGTDLAHKRSVSHHIEYWESRAELNDKENIPELILMTMQELAARKGDSKSLIDEAIRLYKSKNPEETSVTLHHESLFMYVIKTVCNKLYGARDVE